jgi:integrase
VAFFTLMHSCGLRTGEARLLTPSHVHLRDRNLDVASSKGNRSRRLPMTGEVTEVLASCDRASRARFGPSRRTFFVSATGNQVTAATVGVVFRRIWEAAGLPRPAGGQQPRPYDFRHHFAYANVERWARQGRDVTAMLPYLARYMGHASTESSYYYIHTSPDFLHAYADITAESQSLLPEVGFE